jgi:ATP-dependent Clp protease protease subunit
MIQNKNDHEIDDSFLMKMRYAETYVKLSKDRTIFMSENVTKDVAAELSALLLYYDNENHEEPITLYLHSNGGDASGLSNIYDVMQMISAPVKTICLGKCYSAGAVILAAGTKGYRYALKSAKIMIHGIQFVFPIPGTDIIGSKNYYQFVDDNNDNIMKILAHHTGHTLEKVKEDCKQDVWMDAKQALEYGLIDGII